MLVIKGVNFNRSYCFVKLTPRSFLSIWHLICNL
jgi:hypothetical protein